MIETDYRHPEFIKFGIDPPKIEKPLYKFFTLLRSEKKLESLSKAKKIDSWIQKKLNQFENNPRQVTKCHSYVIELLSSETINLKRLTEIWEIAHQYCYLFEKYKPAQDGYLTQWFNFSQLVSLIEFVFKKHVYHDFRLCSGGIATQIDQHKFYIKTENKVLYIVADTEVPIGFGGFAEIQNVYEVTTGKLLALKKAKINKENSLGVLAIRREIKNLKLLNGLLNKLQLTEIGIQNSPLAEFNLVDQKLHGYLTTIWPCNLRTWTKGEHLKSQRITVCISLMQIIKNIHEIGYWHGDIKPRNILIKNPESLLLIDWSGARPIAKALEKFKIMNEKTPEYLNPIDFEQLITAKKNKSQTLFLESIDRLELFAASLTLFKVLVPTIWEPFEHFVHPEFNFKMPNTEKGLHKACMGHMKGMLYSDEIISAITKMLSHHAKDRYSFQEAIDFWEKIDPITGKLRS